MHVCRCCKYEWINCNRIELKNVHFMWKILSFYAIARHSQYWNISDISILNRIFFNLERKYFCISIEAHPSHSLSYFFLLIKFIVYREDIFSFNSTESRFTRVSWGKKFSWGMKAAEKSARLSLLVLGKISEYIFFPTNHNFFTLSFEEY